MSHKAAKLGITGLVLALAFGALLYTSIGESAEYYKHVEEVMATPQTAQSWYGKRLQLHGFVVPDSWLQAKSGSLDYRFQVESKGKVVQAYYTGILPDTFKAGSEVVLKGELRPDGFHVVPDGVVAKCPSKYEPKTAAISTGAAEPGKALERQRAQQGL
jgi:cytochrome c-type biogenesis protein CcmE